MLLEKRKRLLKVLILTSPKQGNEVTLPRMCCDSAEDTDLPFALRKYQFPVRLAWAMAINKSQGQTFGATNRHLLEQAGLCSWAVVLSVVQSYAG